MATKGPFPLTGEATGFVGLTETLGAGLEIPWERWGYANQKRLLLWRVLGGKFTGREGPVRLEPIFALHGVSTAHVKPEAGGSVSQRNHTLLPCILSPQDRAQAEQGPINTCPCLEAFPMDGALTQAMFLTHTGRERQAHTSSAGEDVTYRLSLFGPCLGQNASASGTCVWCSSGADGWTAASPALPLNKAPDNTSPRKPHS